MLHRILVVKSESYWSSKFKDLLSNYNDTFDFTFVEDRKEAVAVLNKASFAQVITALKIPKLSDGYLFLAQIADKHFTSENIILVVDEKTDTLTSNLNSRGVVHLFPSKNLDKMLQFLVKANRKTSSVSDMIAGVTADMSHDLERVKTALNYVMGPVGNMIFKDVVRRWQDHNDLNELFNLIQLEIKDQDKIKLFHDNLS
jgi:DNA-binding NarL/FixJ family response regulator